MRPLNGQDFRWIERSDDSVNDIFTNSLGMKFVRIPAGVFMMGSPENEPGHRVDEQQHRVTITKDFHMQATLLTQGQWEALMESNPSRFKACGKDCPVDRASWDDAQEFILKLNEKESTNRYRLPTEAEWEYACRAGSPEPFCFGQDVSELEYYAWYWKNSDGGIHPVSLKKPNAWGLYDMHGNLWEWCQDWYGPYPTDPVTDPEGMPSGRYHVLRGGSWYNGVRLLRSAVRVMSLADHRSLTFGFRVVREIQP
jgi:formylglycine-generating enzyme required for sulfatase activity